MVYVIKMFSVLLMMTNSLNPLHKNFNEKARSVNAALSFATCGANIQISPGRGDMVFTVNGHPCHNKYTNTWRRWNSEICSNLCSGWHRSSTRHQNATSS